MAQIRFKCSTCFGHIKADESLADSLVECPHCGVETQMTRLSDAVPPAPVAALGWHYEHEGNALGPVPEETIRQLILSGSLLPGNRVWNETMSEWQPIDATPLSAHLPKRVPTAPVTQLASSVDIQAETSAPKPSNPSRGSRPQLCPVCNVVGTHLRGCSLDPRPFDPHGIIERPTGLTVVSWLLIVSGFLMLAITIYVFSKDPSGMDTQLILLARSPKTLGFQKAFAFAGLAVMIACGSLMLNGARLGRWLYVFWNVLGLTTSLAILKPEAYLTTVLPGVVPFVIIVAVIFNRNSRRFFLSGSWAAQPKTPGNGWFRWSIAGLVALLVIGGAVLFLKSSGATGGSAVKSRLLPTFEVSRLEATGYFLLTAGKTKKARLGVVVKVPEERWVPTEKEFQEMTLKRDAFSDWAEWIRGIPRTNVRLYKSSRFTLIRPGYHKIPADGFCISRFNSTVLILPVEVRVAFGLRPEDGQETVLSDASGPVSSDLTKPARPPADGITVVMPFWEVDSDEVPSPLYIQFDGEDPVRIPSMAVAPATEGDSGPIQIISHRETGQWIANKGWQGVNIETARMPDSAPKSQ